MSPQLDLCLQWESILVGFVLFYQLDTSESHLRRGNSTETMSIRLPCRPLQAYGASGKVQLTVSGAVPAHGVLKKNQTEQSSKQHPSTVPASVSASSSCLEFLS